MCPSLPYLCSVLQLRQLFPSPVPFQPRAKVLPLYLVPCSQGELNSPKVCSHLVFRQWRCGSGAVWEKELVSCKPPWTQEGKESPEMLGGTTLDSYFAVSPNRSALNYLK